jgi:tRNA dimethylallyltransferase
VLERLFVQNSGYKAEIVSADSMQVYRGMDIGTAKPSPLLRSQLPHHLIDIRNPDERFDVGDFVHLAEACVQEIAERGGLPVVSGGAGFYLKHFIQGLPEAPPSDCGIRQQLRDEVGRRGSVPLREELSRCDPVSAARIHRNDEYRLLRALEVFRLTGRPLSSFSRSSGGRGGRYRFLIIGLERQREELYRRINERCALMFKNGLAREVRTLFEAGYGPSAAGMRAIGYREFFNGDRLLLDDAGLESVVARDSRRYAKRQLTYFASIPDTVWVASSERFAEQIGEKLRCFYEVH